MSEDDRLRQQRIKKRDAHLKNQDFFKVKEHPKMTFKSTKVKKNKDGDYEVEGDFTLLGKTRSISVVLKKDGDNTGATTFQIKRSDYGMKFMLEGLKDHGIKGKRIGMDGELYPSELAKAKKVLPEIDQEVSSRQLVQIRRGNDAFG